MKRSDKIQEFFFVYFFCIPILVFSCLFDAIGDWRKKQKEKNSQNP